MLYSSRAPLYRVFIRAASAPLVNIIIPTLVPVSSISSTYRRY